MKTHASLGRCYEQKQDFARAIEQHRRALDLAPGNALQQENLIRVLELGERHAEAEALRASSRSAARDTSSPR